MGSKKAAGQIYAFAKFLVNFVWPVKRLKETLHTASVDLQFNSKPHQAPEA